MREVTVLMREVTVIHARGHSKSLYFIVYQTLTQQEKLRKILEKL